MSEAVLPARIRTPVTPPVRLDLRREPTGALILKLGELSRYLKHEEEAYRTAGVEVRCELLNEHISVLDEILTRAHAKLGRTAGVSPAGGTDGKAH